jgi:hypothetical protein
MKDAPAIVAAPPRNSRRCTNFFVASGLFDFDIAGLRLIPADKKIGGKFAARSTHTSQKYRSQ